ncbi:DUF6266 family protein, partial [Daejeonella sp.]|uniref:DUF6266 family protein n=1 Tax=Daejeonella sp. TaxID=2805397 RepID=UPI0030BD8DA2
RIKPIHLKEKIMARLINGIMGAFRGKVGTVVGYTRNGEGIIRGLPRKISKEPTQKQLDNRKKMAACQEWLKLITPFVRIGFKNFSAKQHGFGSALSYLKLNAMTEDLEVDASKALISWGDLPLPVAAAVSNPKPGILEITWEAIQGDTDRAMVLAYDVKQDFKGEVCGERRSEGKQLLDCKDLKGKELHVYLGFVSEERDRCSDSVYLGKVGVR